MKFRRILTGLMVGAICIFTLFSCDDVVDEFDLTDNTDWPEKTTSAVKILIDASHDGGVWWFPQSGSYDPNKYHQGSQLANYLRQSGFTVDELGRDVTIDEAVLEDYRVIVRAGGFTEYSNAELEAYQGAIDKGICLMLLSDHKTNDANGDKLSEMLGLRFEGSVLDYQTEYGAPLADVTKFASHMITDGINSIDEIPAASTLINADENPNVEVLGWFTESAYVDLNFNGVKEDDEPTGMPYMGILNHPTSKIFFMTDMNKIESVPVDLVNNISQWVREQRNCLIDPE